MGTQARRKFRQSCRQEIERLSASVEAHQAEISRLEALVKARQAWTWRLVDMWKSDTAASDAAHREDKLEGARLRWRVDARALSKFRALEEQTREGHYDPEQRVIGHVVWSPAITAGTAPHDFTKDVCVIKLDKSKFLPGFKENAVDLGACCPSHSPADGPYRVQP